MGFDERPLELMKNDFCFMLKALSVLKMSKIFVRFYELYMKTA